MHEFSIAQAIAAIAERNSRGCRVCTVEVRVGHLRQVVPGPLAFAFSLVTEGTALDGAELRITQVPATGRCRACGADSRLEEFPLRCARCGSVDLEMRSGEELLVEALELEEEQACTG